MCPWLLDISPEAGMVLVKEQQGQLPLVWCFGGNPTVHNPTSRRKGKRRAGSSHSLHLGFGQLASKGSASFHPFCIGWEPLLAWPWQKAVILGPQPGGWWVSTVPMIRVPLVVTIGMLLERQGILLGTSQSLFFLKKLLTLFHLYHHQTISLQLFGVSQVEE